MHLAVIITSASGHLLADQTDFRGRSESEKERTTLRAGHRCEEAPGSAQPVKKRNRHALCITSTSRAPGFCVCMHTRDFS